LLCWRHEFEISELSVDRSSTIQLVGRRWVYYRRAALLKESYLLSSLLASFLKFSPCLYASEAEPESSTSVMAHDLRFGARPCAGFTLRHCPCLSKSYSPPFSFTSPVLAPRLSPVCKKYWISSILHYIHYLGFNITQDWRLQMFPGKAGVHFHLQSSPS
jgi:hypothetical protein